MGRMMVTYVVWLLPFERRLAEPRTDQLEFMWRDGDSRAWDTTRLSAVMARMLQADIRVRIGVARPIAIKISRRIRGFAMHQMESCIVEEDTGEDDVDIDPLTGEPVECGGSWNIVWDLQATHGSKVARQHYAVHIGTPGNLQPAMNATFRAISGLWHQFLQDEEGQDGETGTKRAGDPVPELSPSQGAKRAKTTTVVARPDLEAAITAGLRKLLGSEATWRSEKQAESMREIIRLQTDETIMADTGTSIVVVPFEVLMEDLVGRVTAFGVDCLQYGSALSAGRDGPPRAARLVVVSADLVGTLAFLAYADGLLHAGLLQRTFVDECHTVITDIGYRARGAAGLTPFRVSIGVVDGDAHGSRGGLFPRGNAGRTGRGGSRPDDQDELPV
ncbi:hypothetical protein VD0002_g9477 [Verticillium dahliae]|nr:hypothetical protein VD0002_g9477 [Verticillium dahliae]